MLREIFGDGRAGGRRLPARVGDLPRESLLRRDRAHARAPLDRHLEITLGDMRVGGHDLRALSDRCLADSDSKTLALKALHRPLASYFLARYFLYAMTLDGAFAECGVFRGTSALFLCRAARTLRPGYAGEGLHLVDSFQGLSRPSGDDFVDALGEDGSVVRGSVPEGSLHAPIEAARHALREFPAARVHEGWIPAVLQSLPETRWAFVHVDVDLYEPTRDCLDFFYPRLCPGGVIVCDDYGAPLFPGAHRAWDRFCDAHDVPYVVLDTGQSVILKA